MEQVIFSSKEELYNRVLPALKCKKKSLYRDGFKSIEEIDIWDYLRNKKWDNSIGLELCDMIFTNNFDKIYFLRQYLKSFEIGKKEYSKAKKFTKN